MRFSTTMLLVIGLLVVAIGGCGDPAVENGSDLRQIVVVGVDPLRPDHLTSWGYKRDTTPGLDRMAREEATVFERAYASSSWTLPSMTSVFTSLHPMQHQVVDRGYKLDSKLDTLAGTLSDRGWKTAAFITHIYVSSLFGLDSGFDEFHELSIDWEFAEGHQLRADALNEEVLPWLSANADERFFLYVHVFDPHWDYDPPAAWAERFIDPEYRGPASGSWKFIEQYIPTEQLMDKPELDRVVDLYDGEIAWTEHQIGRLIDHLRNLGIWNQALFVLLADHGEELQDHGSMHHIRTLYEEVLRVPLIIKPPHGRSDQARSRVTERVRNLDIAPTILDFAGISSPADFEGISLRPLMSQLGRDRPVFAHTQRHLSDKAALIVDDVKVIHSWAPGQEGTELYDLAADPKEAQNLSSEDPEGTAEARSLLLNEIERMRAWSRERELERATPALTPEQIEHLRALGYVD